MPTSFKGLVQAKLPFIAYEEENLEQGRIWAYTHGNVRTKMCGEVCWVSPGNGIATIEIWGAGGSGAKMCCCGGGIPGNPGAYSKKTICVASGCLITGTVGFSCGNSNDLCFRGCSESTGVCWRSTTTNGCMCAQGGRGGTTYCSTGTSMWCCFYAAGFCGTGPFNANCGIICNYGGATASCCADAFGGDVNSRGGFSRASFFGCTPSCPCSTIFHVATPPGYYSDCGGEITYTNEGDSGHSSWSGMALNGFLYGLNVAGRQPGMGLNPSHSCWTGSRTCGCYDGNGCVQFVPPGFPGLPPFPCGDVRDHAYRGGHGAIRIRFVQDGTVRDL
jgi:hypothetical protein